MLSPLLHLFSQYRDSCRLTNLARKLFKAQGQRLIVVRNDLVPGNCRVSMPGLVHGSYFGIDPLPKLHDFACAHRLLPFIKTTHINLPRMLKMSFLVLLCRVCFTNKRLSVCPVFKTVILT